MKERIKKNIKIPVTLEYDKDLHKSFVKLLFPVFKKVMEMPEFQAKLQEVVKEATHIRLILKEMNLQKTQLPKGCEHLTIEYDNGLKSFNMKNVVLHLEPEQKTSYIKGEVISERVKEKSLNGAVLFYLLKHPKLIPEEWKEKWIYFHGTILRNPHGNRSVLFLYWSDGEWRWNCSCLGYSWSALNPSAVLASSPQSSESKNSTLSTLALCPHCNKEINLTK